MHDKLIEILKQAGIDHPFFSEVMDEVEALEDQAFNEGFQDGLDEGNAEAEDAYEEGCREGHRRSLELWNTMNNIMRENWNLLKNQCYKAGLPVPILLPSNPIGWEIKLPEHRKFRSNELVKVLTEASVYVEGFIDAMNRHPSNQDNCPIKIKIKAISIPKRDRVR